MNALQQQRCRMSPVLFVFGNILVGLCAVAGIFVPGMFYAGVCFGAVLAAFYTRRAITHWRDFSPYTALALNFAAGYMIGPAVGAMYYLTTPTLSPLSLAGPFAFGGNTQREAIALIFSALIVSELILLGMFSKNHLLLKLSHRHHQSMSRGYVSVLGLVIIVVAGFLTGDLGYMGIQLAGDSQKVSILGSLGMTALPALPAVFLTLAVESGAYRWRRLFLFGLAVIALLASAVTGRRFLLVSAVSAVFVISAIHGKRSLAFRFRLTTLGGLRALLAASILVVVVAAGVGTFLYLRNTVDTLDADGGHASLYPSVSDAANLVTTGKSLPVIAQAAARSGTLLGYLGELLESPGPDMHGKCVVGAIVTAIPRLMLPNKQKDMGAFGCTDLHVNAIHGLPEIDSPTTILTQAYADFNVFGPFIYVLIIALMYRFIGVFLKIARSQCFDIFIVAVAVYALVYPENDLSFYLVTLRNLAILSTMAMFIEVLCRRRRTRGRGRRMLETTIDPQGE